MRMTALLAVMTVTATAAADARPPPPRAVRGETIIIHDYIPPKIAPKPRKNPRIAPRYSDAAIERDAWTTAWLLLDIDATGTVTRVKFVKRPGYDLESIAVKQALGLKFEPAQDAFGHPVRTLMLWPIEWPSYWWMVQLTGFATRIPADVSGVPCAGSGPLQMDSVHPVYRDCSVPDLAHAEREAWIAR